MEGITPEAGQYTPPVETITLSQADLDAATALLTDETAETIDFVSLGCPHLTIDEIARIADLLEGQHVTKEFWITTARQVKHEADQLGYTRIIEAAGAKFAADTCCVVAPIKGRFRVMATDSAKAYYYAYSKNKIKTIFLPFDEVVRMAVQ
jgi:predicted aconitase